MYAIMIQMYINRNSTIKYMYSTGVFLFPLLYPLGGLELR